MDFLNFSHQSTMYHAFHRQLAERCRVNEQRVVPLTMCVGVETEYLLVDNEGHLIDESLRNHLLSIVRSTSPEIGASAIETHTNPVPIVSEAGGLLREAERLEREVSEQVAHYGCRLVRIGSYPGALDDIEMTKQPERYRYLVETFSTLRGRDKRLQIGTIPLPQQPGVVMGGCQSTHLNIQLPAGALAIRLLNRALELVPYLIAVSANAGLLDCQFSGLQEIRPRVWEALFGLEHVEAQLGVDTRRVGMPDDYYVDWNAYWQDVSSKVFLTNDVEHAFESNLKHFWRLARLKPCPGRINDCLLEIRALSIQPSVAEDVALHLLAYGLLHMESETKGGEAKPLLPMAYVQTNLRRAMQYGLDAKLFVMKETGSFMEQPAHVIVKRLLDRAANFWYERSHEAAELVDMLRRRLEMIEGTPNDTNLRLYQQSLHEGQTREEAAHTVLLANTVEIDRVVGSWAW